MLAKEFCFSSTTSQHQLCHMASYFQPDIICKSFKSPNSLNFINEHENSASPFIITLQVFPNNSACRHSEHDTPTVCTSIICLLWFNQTSMLFTTIFPLFGKLFTSILPTLLMSIPNMFASETHLVLKSPNIAFMFSW